MVFKPAFPTKLHQDAAAVTRDYFLAIAQVDTVLVVNSCARGQAVPESDLDMAILVNADTFSAEIKEIESAWQVFAGADKAILQYKRSGLFAHLHLNIIDGKYIASAIDPGEPIDYFEIEIGNHLCYSAPMGEAGTYFISLQQKWLPYYDETLRAQRLLQVIKACEYDLNHIPFFVKRKLYFQAFEILYKAFQEYLQALFIANKTYPIAYNKWIAEQVTKWLNMPGLYPKLPPIISISNIETDELCRKATMLRDLLMNL